MLTQAVDSHRCSVVTIIICKIMVVIEIGIDSASLCFEIHGEQDRYFNLVTDKCVSVNAHYFTVTDYLNGIDIIAVRAVNNDDQCAKVFL